MSKELLGFADGTTAKLGGPVPTPPYGFKELKPDEKEVFSTGAVRSKIEDAEYYLIMPYSLGQIARCASQVSIPRLISLEHIESAVDRIYLWLNNGVAEHFADTNVHNLNVAALHAMYAIDPRFRPVANKGTNHQASRPPAYHLLPFKAIQALAEAYAEGKQKYPPYNWEKGMPARAMFNHGLKHAWQIFSGDTSEPHHSHFLWNIVTGIYSIKHWPHLNDGHFRVNGNPPKE
jgi:hypothetical protein